MLELKDISKVYKNKKALDQVSLTLTEGIYGLLGPNGAGKSTLMNIITGNIESDTGTVRWNGEEIRSLGEAYRSILGYAPQQQGLYDTFSGRRFLSYMATLKGIPRKEMKDEIERVLSYVNLSDMADRLIGTYSGGMKQRILIAQAILGDPKLIVMDEPTAGLDPKERVRIREKIAAIAGDRIIFAVLLIFSQIFAVMMVSLVMVGISDWRKKDLQALFFGLLILVIPLVLKWMGFDFAGWISVYPIYAWICL